MTNGIRIAILLLAPIAFNHSLADESGDEKRTEKQARPVSKEVYDKIQRTQGAIDYLASIGISMADVEPNNLQFSSESFQDCIAQVEVTLSTEEELAIGRVSCVMRHLEEWRNDLAE
jgi:hypothetical protein